jgi:cysteinyl-tRNA synthetase
MPPIFLFNSLGRQKQEFKSLQLKQVGLYSCGPTVYDRAHIGNLRSFVFADVLRRNLKLNGYAVKHVMNITDVGHLVSDADEGEDKLEKGARREGKTAWEVAQMYTDLFLDDLKRLNILTPEVMPKATDHIKEQIEMISALEREGFTYIIDDGVYFATAKLPSYGQLSGQSVAEKQAGARVNVNDQKRSASDFALWKFSPANEQRQMEWDSPWGKGFPGWHIECSAMSEKYLGMPFDIHTGGVDHIAVHHENEIAQTQAARGVLEANYWLHNEFLLVDGGKMGKSLNNTYSLDDLEAKDISAAAFRYFLLGAHYRTPLNFTWGASQAAQTALNKLVDTVRDWDAPTEVDQKLIENFLRHLNNDLDTAGALALVWTMVADKDLATGIKAATLKNFDQVLGLGLAEVIAQPLAVPETVQKLLKDREAARQAKDFEKADQLRQEIAAHGFVVEDTGGGQRVRGQY